MAVLNTRDVVYTPFMIRVADGTPAAAEPELVPSTPRSLARAVDDWCAMRGRAEHVVAEANSMLDRDGGRVELTDVPGELAFVVGLGVAWARVAMIRSGSEGHLELERSWARGAEITPTEPADPAVLEEIVMKMLVPTGR